MGMYTGLRCKVIIKKDYIKDIIELIENEYEWEKCSNELFKRFGENFSRASFIPCGSLSYMPDEWEELTGIKNSYGYDVTKDADGFKRAFYTESGLWCFQCSLKNYGSEIEFFIENILRLITEKIIHLEKLYEESDCSTMYDLIGEKIIEINKYIRYREDDSSYYGWFKQEEPIKDENDLTDTWDYNTENIYRIGESIT